MLYVGPKDYLMLSKLDHDLQRLAVDGRGLAALFTEADRVARFGFTQTELDRYRLTLLKAFEQLGDGEVAYIKQLNLDLAQKLFPALRGKLEGIDLYAVLGADGTPLALTDSRNAAIANAIENDLVPLSVH